MSPAGEGSGAIELTEPNPGQANGFRDGRPMAARESRRDFAHGPVPPTGTPGSAGAGWALRRQPAVGRLGSAWPVGWLV